MPEPHLRSFIKWAGGKYSELPVIMNELGTPRRYFEPFVGGGAVLWNLPVGTRSFASDRIPELIDIYRFLSTSDAMFAGVFAELAGFRNALADGGWPDGWRRISREAGDALEGLTAEGLTQSIQAYLDRKRGWMLRNGIGETSREEVETTGILGGYFTAVRNSLRLPGLTPAWRAAAFWFVREYAYAGLFKPTRSGGECVAYCGRTGNGRDILNKLASARGPRMVARLSDTSFYCCDFSELLGRHQPAGGDVVFLDPPYDRNFSDYNGHPFGIERHLQLRDWMASAVGRDAPRVVMVIAETDFSRTTYGEIPGYSVTRFDKTYMQQIKSRIDTKAVHLLIRNSA